MTLLPCRYLNVFFIAVFGSYIQTQIAFADMPFSVVSNPGHVQRDYPSQIGLRFKNETGENVVITKLGRWVQPGNSQAHTLYLYDEDAKVLGSVGVSCEGATTNAFVWGTLPSPVTLSVGQIVYVMSTEISGGDKHYYAYGAGQGLGQVVQYADIGSVTEATFDGVRFNFYGTSGLTHGPTSFQYSSPVKTWKKNGTIYTTDGTYYQMISAMKDASHGDTVLVPAGTYTWGQNATKLTIKAGVTLAGVGQGATIVNLHPTATPGFTETLITLNNESQLRRITFNGPVAGRVSLLSSGAASGWRVSEVGYHQAPGQSGYFAFLQYAASGLFDNCNITGGTGNTELIFHRGPANSWQTNDSLGGTANIFVEDCTFNGGGYVCDANSNSRMVVRYCTINGGIKVDGHGLASNAGPPRGVRHMEIYGNTWTPAFNFWTAIEVRGGTGMIFGNRCLNTPGSTAWFFLTDYGYTATWPNFGNVYQTPTNYPVTDQIGVGMDPKTGGSAPMYLWDNLAAATLNAGKATLDWTLTWKAIPQAAINLYRTQIGNPNATYNLQDVIKADRDYFKHTHGTTFDGSSGVGVGTRAQMLALRPSKAGVGFWATDEGEWNSERNGPDGTLYTWTGNSWTFKYIPYTYPHPMRSATLSVSTEPPAPSALSVRPPQ